MQYPESLYVTVNSSTSCKTTNLKWAILLIQRNFQLQESLEDAETNTDVIHKYNTST
jgi:hypothetical protein